MVCRQFALASVALALARADSGLDDPQAQSVFHQLRHELAGQGGTARPAFSFETAVAVDRLQREITDRLQREITERPDLLDQRRAGLLARVDRGSGQDTPVDVVHAVLRMPLRAERAAVLLALHLEQHARRLALPVEEVRDRFTTSRSAAVRGRQRRASPAERDRWAGLPLDPATRHALAELEEAPSRVDRCDRCGQWLDARGHRCPAGPALAQVQHLPADLPIETLASTDEVKARGYAAGPVVAALEEAPLATLHELPVRALATKPALPYHSPCWVTGHLLTYLDATGDRVQVLAGEIDGSCRQTVGGGACEHVTQVGEAVRDRLQAELDATRRGPDAALADVDTTPGLVPVDESTVHYTTDPAAFLRDVLAALADPPDYASPFALSGVLHGRAAGRRFGLEVEFDIDTTTEAFDGGVGRAREQVGEALFSAGVTRYPVQDEAHQWRAGPGEGVRGQWQYEDDGSVTGGEVVSPLLDDDEESWSSLVDACTAITTNSGAASMSTGGHVNISADDFAGSPDRVDRLLLLMERFDPELHVLATYPAGGRGRHYAAPVITRPPLGYVTIGEAQMEVTRYSVVNIDHIEHAAGAGSLFGSRLEFRLWDGSLEPGRIQLHTYISAAMADVAARAEPLPTSPGPVPTCPVQDARHSPDRWEASTAGIRTLIDTLCRRDLDKQRLAALWATNRY